MTARSAVTRLVRSRRAHAVAAGIAVLSLAALCFLATSTPAATSGYIAKVTNSTDTIAVAPTTCTQAATLDRAVTPAIFQYALNDAPLYLSAADASGAGNFGNYRTVGAQAGSATTPLSCSRDGGLALIFNGSSTALTSNATSASPANYSIEAWIKTTVAGGKIIGIGSSATGLSGTYDRQLYVDTNGKVEFGSYNGATQTLVSPSVVTDGLWHHVVGTQSSTAGMILYVDGAQVATGPTYLTAQANTGYWRIGYDNLAGWPNVAANYFFTGQMRFVAAYSGILTAQQVKGDYLAGK